MALRNEPAQMYAPISANAGAGYQILVISQKVVPVPAP